VGRPLGCDLAEGGADLGCDLGLHELGDHEGHRLAHDVGVL
jgi:hypothetical protein